jgi:hypothetical protein
MAATSQAPMMIALYKNPPLPDRIVRQYEIATTIKATETAAIISLHFLPVKKA